MSGETPKPKRLDPKVQKAAKVIEESLAGIDCQLERLQDPELKAPGVLEDLAKSFDRIALLARLQIVLLTGEDQREVNPLLRVTLLNLKSEVNAALMDLELRPHAPSRWEEFAGVIAGVQKTAKAVQQVIVQPGAAAHVSVQGEPLRTPEGEELVEGVR